MLPEGWQTKTVFELGHRERNTVQTGPFGSQLHSADYVEDGVPLLLIRNIGATGLILGNLPRITEDDARRLARYALAPGDVVFSRVGRVGSCFLATEEQAGWIISGQTLRIRLPYDELDPRYFLYALLDKDAQDFIGGASVGTTRTSINTSILESLPIRFPALPEQRKIARILSTVDDLIERTEALIAKHRAIKQGLMHDLLTRGVDASGRLRPTREAAPGLYRESAVGWVPREWEVAPVRDVIIRVIDFRGKTPLKIGMQWGGDIPALSANNVEMGRINLAKETYYGSAELYERWMSKGDCEKGDVIMTMEAPLGNIAQIPDDRYYILSQRVLLFKTDRQRIVSDFWMYQLMGSWFQSQLRRNSSGSTATGIQQSKLVRIPVVVPRYSEQEAIAAMLRRQNSYVKQLETHSNKLIGIKAGIMHDLLTGRVRANA